ncbi:MAG: cobyric acid synthase [Dysgonomonas sp.]
MTLTKKQQFLYPIMFAGTGSDVGKSIIASAFCRIFLQDGYSPAPFKAQNMALNSFATPDGLEIGRAQAVQAEAAGIVCQTDMNPLLLKPASDTICQVILNGEVVGNQSAISFFDEDGRDYLRHEVNAAFDRLSACYNPIVMEGAGSISEINLRSVDLVNMPMAMHAGANVILVADIDRGGVFASVYGSVMLLKPEERKHLKGILINKFRGDIRLFESGIKMLEDLCGIPVVGVIPYFRDIYIEEEDSVMLQAKNRQSLSGKVNVAVVLLKHLSNFTDFNMLEHDSRVHLYYTNDMDEIRKADIVLIPGSKNTLSDLEELRRTGIARSIVEAQKSGTTVVGICGGYQMMGLDVYDPFHIEGNIDHLPGLGLLPVVTHIGKEKVTRQSRFLFLDSDSVCQGYEIHMGETIPLGHAAASPLNRMQDGRLDGYLLNNKCFGTYIHGILDNRVVIDYLLLPYTDKSAETIFPDVHSFKEEQYNKLALHVRRHVDMDLIYKIMNQKVV